jgi:hypothetical protein
MLFRPDDQIDGTSDPRSDHIMHMGDLIHIQPRGGVPAATKARAGLTPR